VDGSEEATRSSPTCSGEAQFKDGIAVTDDDTKEMTDEKFAA
jgi:hypothetical protein